MREKGNGSLVWEGGRDLLCFALLCLEKKKTRVPGLQSGCP